MKLLEKLALSREAILPYYGLGNGYYIYQPREGFIRCLFHHTSHHFFICWATKYKILQMLQLTLTYILHSRLHSLLHQVHHHSLCGISFITSSGSSISKHNG